MKIFLEYYLFVLAFTSTRLGSSSTVLTHQSHLASHHHIFASGSTTRVSMDSSGADDDLAAVERSITRSIFYIGVIE